MGQSVHASTPYLGAYQDLMAQVRTETYANGFYVVAIMSLIAAGVAVFMRSGRKKDAGGAGARRRAVRCRPRRDGLRTSPLVHRG